MTEQKPVTRAQETDLEFALAQLRHAYENIHSKRVSRRGMEDFANGLIAPQIRRLEQHKQALDTQHTALRALVQQWREMAKAEWEAGPIPHDEIGHAARWTAVEMCADALATLLGDTK